METNGLIPIEALCTHYTIELSFIESLQEHGLIEVTVIENTPYLLEDQLNELEKMIRLRYDLNINPEGIDAIYHLLKQVHGLQRELAILKGKEK